MSKVDSNDLNMPGYFLPEDSQSRLKKLRNHIAFLSRLAQPRTWNEQEYKLGVSATELAICLESLEEQVALVLQEVSWPAQRKIEVAEASENDVAPMESHEVSGATAEGFAFGITVDQIDALNRLIQTISAHGDVVACSRSAGLADDTLPRVGQAIYDGMEAVRAILGEVEAQQLGQEFGPRTGVREERAVYDVRIVSPGAAGSAAVVPTPTYAYAGQSRRMHPH